MEIFYVFGLCLSFLIFVSGIGRAIENKEFNDFLYIRLYTPERDRIANRMLVIGFMRCVFKFRLFTYIKLK